ncbi:MAG TPA: phosphoesterase [Chloroflexota bacterium]|nr:phosphoesterase [Chloroflexota bacterium]
MASDGRRGDEKLVVIAADFLRAIDLKQGFDPNAERVLEAVFTPGVASFLARSLAENDPRYKQIICYVILRAGRSIFHYQRSSRAGESRLAGLRSLGVGGHLNADDAKDQVGRQWLDRAIQRELQEEVELTEAAQEIRIRYVGIINDDTSEVGQVHVGIVAVADLIAPAVRLSDTTLHDGRFNLPEDLIKRSTEFETWSQLCLPALLSLPETS